MISKYQQAANTRKRGLVGSITDRLVAGQGIGGAIGSGISETFKAKSTGIKEKFDPLNIAKMLTGNLGMALVGKITSRKSEDMEYFLNKGRKKGESYRQVSAPESKVGKVDTAFYTTIREGQRGSLQKGDNVATVAARLVNLLKTFYERETLQRELLHNFDEENQFEDQIRHDNLIKEIKNVSEKKLTKEEIEKLKSQQQQKNKTEGTKELEFPQKPKSDAATAAVSKPAAKPEVDVVKAKEVVAPVKPVPTVTPAKPPTPTAKIETSAVTPKVEASAPVSAIKTPTTTSSSGVSTATKAAVGVAGTVAAVGTALADVGITNEFTKKAIMGNIGKESNFQNVGENLNYTTVKRVREVFPSVTSSMSDEEIKPYLGNPEKFTELVYGHQTAKGKELGNKEPGDAWKFRGRGLIQLTGRYNYEKIGKALNVDLVKNPELVNDPALAPKIVAIYVKQRLKDKVNSFTNQRDANREVTKSIVGANVDLNKGIGAQQLAKVENYTNNTSGEKMYASSTQNEELKQRPSVTNVAINNTKTIINSGSNEQPQVISMTSPDDYPLLATSPA
jgi:predicted chitinase